MPSPSSRPPVATFHARQGRVSALTRTRLAERLPARRLPDGVIDPVVVFGRVSRFVLEIGSGLGDSALAYAAAHADADVVGVEVHRTGVARLVAGADERGLPNVWAELGDGLALVRERVGAGTVDELHVFFPDPWPKRKHAKRRLLTPQTLALFADRLRPDGLVRFGSDHPVMVEHALAAVSEHGGYDVAAVPRPSWRPETGYEAKGRREGREPTFLELRPRR